MLNSQANPGHPEDSWRARARRAPGPRLFDGLLLVELATFTTDYHGDPWCIATPQTDDAKLWKSREIPRNLTIIELASWLHR